MNDEPKKPVRCSFCGKRESEVRRMLQGPGARICDQCVELCMSLLEEELGAGGGVPAELPAVSYTHLTLPTIYSV